MSLEEWNKETAEDISVSEVDRAILEYDEADKAYKETKKICDTASKEKSQAAAKVLDLLARSKKSKFVVDNLGTAYIINKLTVTTPKTNPDKEALFKYIKEKYGHETFMGFAGINSARLNSFFNEEAALAAKEGVANFEMPGVQQPQSYQTLGFRRK